MINKAIFQGQVIKIENQMRTLSKKVVIETGEGVKLGDLEGLLNTYCNIYISEGAISDESAQLLDQTPQIQEPPKGKSPSQRLRSIIWIWWNQQGAKGEFNDFYDAYIEKIIEHTKEKLDQDG